MSLKAVLGILPAFVILAACQPATNPSPIALSDGLAKWECKNDDGVKNAVNNQLPMELSDEDKALLTPVEMRSRVVNQQFAYFIRCPLNPDLQVLAIAGTFDIPGQSDRTAVGTIASRIMVSIDENFREYESQILRQDSDVRVVPRLVDTLIPIAGFSGNVSASALGAAALFNSGYSTVLQTYYSTDTVGILTRKMRADREKTRTVIETKTDGTGSDDYTVSKLMIALQSYHLVGTIQHAATALSSEVQGKSAAE